jgi:hypothetical protein
MMANALTSFLSSPVYRFLPQKNKKTRPNPTMCSYSHNTGKQTYRQREGGFFEKTYVRNQNLVNSYQILVGNRVGQRVFVKHG